MEKDCSALSPPHIIWGPLDRLVGMYNGKETIYVVEGLFGYDRKAVLMHESIHYVQTKLDGLELPNWPELVCPAENQAFTLTDEWLRDQIQYQYIVGPEWWQNYSYCREFYDPDYISFNPLPIHKWDSIIF